MSIKVKDNGNFADVLIKDAVIYWAKLGTPQEKYMSSDKEFSATLFVSEEDAAALEDEAMINKNIVKAWTGKNTKRKVSYPEDKFPDVDGLFGFKIAMPEFTKGGKRNSVFIIDADGESFADPNGIGNGSKVNVKVSGYRNKDGLLNIIGIPIVQVTELVEYSGGSGGATDGIFDADFGVTIPASKPSDRPQAKPVESKTDIDDDFDEDDVPF